MPGSMPTVRLASLFDRLSNRPVLRMDIPLRNRHVSMASEFVERPRVHVRRPTRQACVLERVQRERLYVVPLLARLRIVFRIALAGSEVLFLYRRGLDMAASGLSREDPLRAFCILASHLQHGPPRRRSCAIDRTGRESGTSLQFRCSVPRGSSALRTPSAWPRSISDVRRQAERGESPRSRRRRAQP